MPHIAITMYPGRDHDTKAALAEKMRTAIAGELGISEAVVSVSIQDIEKENWDKEMEKIPDEAMFIRV